MKINPPISILSKMMGIGMLWGKSLLDNAVEYSTLPFQQHDIILPRLDEKYYSWTHYGIFFPDLAEPFRYLNIVILLGTPTSLAFDPELEHQDHTLPRQQASVFSSTAATTHTLLKAYVIPDETQIQADGRLLQFGQEIKISGTLPHIEIEGQFNSLKFHFNLNVSNQVSWLIKTPVFDHFSLLAQYQGCIEFEQQQIEQQGLCSYEYARSVSLHSLIAAPIHDSYKIPIDFYTHQIINLDQQTQILLTQANLLNTPAVVSMHIRRLDQANQVYQQVKFKVLAHYIDEFSSPTGEKMRLPKNFTWQAFDEHGKEFFEIFARVNAAFHYGRGRGYASSFEYTGHFHQQPIQGQGYLEYINIEDQSSFGDEPDHSSSLSA